MKWRFPKRDIRILVADDEARILEMVKLLLEHQGYQVIPAWDGEEALEKIRSELPDMVILDIIMPKRDGLAVCKAVRSSVETMFIPIVMLTGQDSVEEKLRGLSAGADDYITKPFNADELLARIEAVLRRSYQKRDT
jgi:DNA-binding response OmpR family regulator